MKLHTGRRSCNYNLFVSVRWQKSNLFQYLSSFEDLSFQGEKRAVVTGTKLKGITRSTENPTVQPCRQLHCYVLGLYDTRKAPHRLHYNLFSRLQLSIKVTLMQKVIVSILPRSSNSPTHALYSLYCFLPLLAHSAALSRALKTVFIYNAHSLSFYLSSQLFKFALARAFSINKSS